jgi:hypothetical protein
MLQDHPSGLRDSLGPLVASWESSDKDDQSEFSDVSFNDSPRVVKLASSGGANRLNVSHVASREASEEIGNNLGDAEYVTH